MSKLEKIKIAAVVACRVASTRLFCKPLQRVDHRSILELSISQLRKSKLIKRIVLAISNEPGNEVFVEFAKKQGLKFVRGSDKDVLKRTIEGAKKVGANVVFRVTSEDPLKHWKIFDKVIVDHVNSGADLTTTEGLPEGVGFEVVNLDSLKKSHKKGNEREREHVTLYLYNHKRDFKINRFLPEVKFYRPELRFTVDNPEDLILVRKIMAKLPPNSLPDLNKILKILDENPKLKEINKEFAPHIRYSSIAKIKNKMKKKSRK